MKIREYYERLAQVRAGLREELDKRQVKGEITLWSAEYHHSFKEKMYKEIINKVRSNPKMRVLNLGCGRCFDDVNLSRQCDYCGFGLDFSLTQLKLGAQEESLNNYRFIQADVNVLALKDKTLDMVIFSEVIEHLTDAADVLNEIYRVLKDDGCLVLTTPNRYDYFHFIGRLLPTSFRKRLRWAIQTQFDVDSSEYTGDLDIEEHAHLYSYSELVGLLNKHNFSVEKFVPGKLAVPLPALFDRYKFLQKCWSKLDDLLAKTPLSKCIYRQFIFVLRKK